MDQYLRKGTAPAGSRHNCTANPPGFISGVVLKTIKSYLHLYGGVGIDLVSFFSRRREAFDRGHLCITLFVLDLLPIIW